MGGRSGQKQGGAGLNNKVASLIAATASDAAAIHKGDIAAYENYVYKDKDNPRNGKTTAELKSKVGAYIATEKIYGRDAVSIPPSVKYYIQDLGKAKTENLINSKKTELVNINKINIMQKYVFEKPLKAAIQKKDTKVVLFQHNGNLYLNDGNHRVAAAKLRGLKNVRAVIVDVD